MAALERLATVGDGESAAREATTTSFLHKKPADGRHGREMRRWMVLTHETGLLTWHKEAGAAALNSMKVESIRALPVKSRVKFGLEFVGEKRSLKARAESGAVQKVWLKASPDMQKSWTRGLDRAHVLAILRIQRFVKRLKLHRLLVTSLSKLGKLPHENYSWVSVVIRGLRRPTGGAFGKMAKRGSVFLASEDFTMDQREIFEGVVARSLHALDSGRRPGPSNSILEQGKPV